MVDWRLWHITLLMQITLCLVRDAECVEEAHNNWLLVEYVYIINQIILYNFFFE